MKKDESDEYYLRQVLRGNKSAYSEIINRYKSMVFTIAFKILRNREEAEDVSQESFIKVYENLLHFNFNANLKTWLYRITYNTAISELRKRKPVTISAELEDDNLGNDFLLVVNSAIEKFARSDREKYLSQAVDTLNEEDQTIIWLYYKDDCNLETIADITGLTKANIKIRLFRARKKIYIELKNKLQNEVFNLL